MKDRGSLEIEALRILSFLFIFIIIYIYSSSSLVITIRISIIKAMFSCITIAWHATDDICFLTIHITCLKYYITRHTHCCTATFTPVHNVFKTSLHKHTHKNSPLLYYNIINTISTALRLVVSGIILLLFITINITAVLSMKKTGKHDHRNLMCATWQ